MKIPDYIRRSLNAFNTEFVSCCISAFHASLDAPVISAMIGIFSRNFIVLRNNLEHGIGFSVKVLLGVGVAWNGEQLMLFCLGRNMR